MIYEADRCFERAVRLPEELPTDIHRLERLPVATTPFADGPGYVLLAEVATIESSIAPNQLNRENGKRRIVVTANIGGRDYNHYRHSAGM